MDDKSRNIAVIILVLVIAGAGWWYFSSYKSSNTANQVASTTPKSLTPATSTVGNTVSTTLPRKYINVKVKTPAPSTTSTKAVSKIALTFSGATNVSWKVTGYSKNGFYLVWSQSIHPTYPVGKGSQYRYYSDPNTNWGTIITSGKRGVFYARVCESLGTVCGTYSNEISISL